MSENQSVDQASYALGKLEASVSSLQNLIMQQSEESRDARKKVYAKLEEVVLNAQAANNRIADLEVRLKNIEPVVDDVRKMRTVAAAGLAIGVVVSGTLGWVWQHIPWFPRP